MCDLIEFGNRYSVFGLQLCYLWTDLNETFTDMFGAIEEGLRFVQKLGG